MLISYLKIAFRNLLKNKVYTAINLLGLAFGIASVFLIAIYIKGELSYDRFHNQAENLYRVIWEDENPQTRTPHPMAQALVNDFPEIESAVSLTPLFGAGLTREMHSFRNLEKDERYDEANILAVDTTFFKVFSFPLVQGNPKTALHHVNGGLLISESMAKKYFGDADPMGKHLAVDSDTMLVEVVGVFKDVPRHAHFHFDFLVSYVREKSFDPEDEFYSWADFGHYNYLRLKSGADAKQLEGRLMEWAKNYFHPTEDQYERLLKANFGFRLQPVTDIHLHSRLRWELEPNGNIYYIYILATAAILTLIIACVNFINLTTAKSAERAKEIGVRKSLGAFRKQLALQFISESFVVTLAAVLLSILFIESGLPFFNSFMDTALEIDSLQYFAVLGLGSVIGIISGFYPALYLSAVKPSLILKGNVVESRQGTGLQNGLIVFQFALSMALISGSLIIFSQLDFLKNHDLGFDREGVVVLPIKSEALRRQFEPLRNELMKIEGVQAVSATSNIPGKQFNQNPIAAVNDPSFRLATSECLVDADFFSVMDIGLKEGRLFSRDHQTDSTLAFVLNETAASQLNLGVGSEVNWDRDGSLLRGEVIGVVKDFHFQSLHEPLRPLLFALGGEFSFIVLRMDLANLESGLPAIAATYKQFDPLFTFEFSFLDDQLDQQYSSEKSLGNAVAVFAIIAIVIAAFGLFAIALLAFYRRTKEIGIRKILGASPAGLLYLILKNFTGMVLIAIVLATPFTWWMMNRWLENFTYRITVGPMVFILAGISLIVMCWVTLSYMTVKATRLNPAETLKSE